MKEQMKKVSVGFEILTAVAMNWSVFWDLTILHAIVSQKTEFFNRIFIRKYDQACTGMRDNQYSDNMKLCVARIHISYVLL
jgi:hypothetical protein